MELFIQRLIDGITNGAIYSVIAIALVLIFKATTLVNFAQGELAMLGTFFVYVLAAEQGLNVWVAIPIAMALSALLAAGIERVLIRPFDPSDHLPVVIITLGLFLIINSVAGEVWNFQTRRFQSPFPNNPLEDRFDIFGARLQYSALGLWVTLGVMLAAIWLILNRTKVGLSFRAVSSNTEAARLVGIHTGRTLQFGWALAGAIGTLGGAVVANFLFGGVDPNIMARLLIFSFAAAALGGLDSIGGAVVGGSIVGLAQSMLVGYGRDIPGLDWLDFELSLFVAFAVIIAILWVRPAGLFGTQRVERV